MGLVHVGDGYYDAEGAAKIARWVELLAVFVGLMPESVENFKRATELLARRAQAQYVQLESGEQLRLDIADLEGSLDDILKTQQEKLTFLIVTGDVLIACIDGPQVGAGVLCEALDQMLCD